MSGMSVPVSKRGSNKYDPVEKARELAVYTLRITKNEKVFVGEYREAVAEQISNLAIGIDRKSTRLNSSH